MNRVIEPAANLGAHVYVKASCGGINEYNCPANDGDANGYAAVVDLYGADVTLEQTAGPSAAEARSCARSRPYSRAKRTKFSWAVSSS